MKPILSMLVCMGLWQSSQAIDTLEAYPHAVGLLPVAAVDVTTLREPVESPHNALARGLCLDAELLDREGRRWSLQWKLLGGQAAKTGRPGGESWRAGVVLNTPDGELHERIFARGAGLVGPLASAADDWEWRPQGATLLPAKLRFDIDGREVILLLESLESSATGDTQAPARVRVRGFVNQGIDKTYLSGRGQLERDWQRLAGRAQLHAPRNPASAQPADRL